ncbi:terpenoid cyclases/protein prenyltransferase alpha-alpha toroid, partial [Zopfochytrium polystomum]
HIEGVSTVFGTALNYVALRLLGVPPDDPVCVKARATLHKLGGATGVPSWGKFWLAVLNVYDWAGNNSIPPELWIIPEFMPIHASRMWVHSRMVYLPMSYLYGVRFQAKVDPLILALREELYTTPYDQIYWPAQRNNVAKVDLYSPHTKIMDFLNGVLACYEWLPNSWLRKPAIAEALRQIRYEDTNTKYLDLGPGAEGMMMNGTNGSQLWDTSFAISALVETGLATEPEFRASLDKAIHFLDVTQIKQDPTIPHSKCYRHITKGAFPFSTRDQSYTVSDCTAEGLKAVLLLQHHLPFKLPNPVSTPRIHDAVNVLLSMQNADDGGIGSYEKRRAPFWLEWMNVAEVFGNIMLEYSYPECTTSVVIGLSAFKEVYPDHRRKEIDATIARAVKYILNVQKPDGSWFGSWAICFTYGTLFALESLASVGMNYENSEPVRRACHFLASKQNPDGGWGESYKSCETNTYVPHPAGSQVVNTSWAMLALLAAGFPQQDVLRRAARLVMQRQRDNGEWLQEGIEGVFNKFIFTMWALGKYAKVWGNEPIV